MSANQRKYARVPFSGPIKFFDWNRPIEAEGAEISGNGVFLRTTASLPEGSLLTLRLGLPGADRSFTVLGKVVRTVRGGLFRPAGMGVRFVDIAAPDRRQVLEYVARRTLRAA